VSVSRTAQLRRSLLLFIDALLHIIVSRQKTSTPVAQVQYVWQEQPAPETPMPEAPLIRVLETFDLSSTNVEHFLDSKADLKALVPNSVTGTLQEHI
jgi:nicotinic acid mononucleotide adenylyltransferase